MSINKTVERRRGQVGENLPPMRATRYTVYGTFIQTATLLYSNTTAIDAGLATSAFANFRVLSASRRSKKYHVREKNRSYVGYDENDTILARSLEFQ